MMFESRTMLANLAMKLTVTAEIFLIDTQTPVMMKATGWTWRKRACRVVNVVQYSSFYLLYFLKIQIVTWDEVVNFAAHSLGMQYPVVTADQGYGTKMVNWRSQASWIPHVEVVQCSFRCGYQLCIWVQVTKVTLGSDSPNAVDTGAAVSFIPESTYSRVQTSTITLKSYTGELTPIAENA